MPVFDYACDRCGRMDEDVYRKARDKGSRSCEGCGAIMRKLPAAPTVYGDDPRALATRGARRK